MRTRRLVFASALCSAALVSAGAFCTGCGSLDGDTSSSTTLATVHGQLSNAGDVPVGNDVRVAVVWLSQGPSYSVAEDLPVQPVFPSQFVIHLDSPPPQGVMFSPKGDTSSGFQVAFGFVVAYEDLNGNGKLDLVQSDAGAFVDKIVGANESLALVYLQGTIPSGGNLADSSGTLPSPGYNLYAMANCTLPPPDVSATGGCTDGGTSGSPSAPAADGGTCVPSQWLGIDTPYDLAVSAAPEINQLMCQSFGQGGSTAGASGAPWYVDKQGTPPGGYPPAGAQGLVCTSATSYDYAQCQTIHDGLCDETQNCTYTSVDLGSAPTPPGWPCSNATVCAGATGSGQSP